MIRLAAVASLLIAAIAGIALYLVRRAAPRVDGWDEMCPNCVTPWKCNGPHTLDRDAWPEGVGWQW